MIKNFLIILVFVLSACNNSVQEVEIKEVEKKQIVNENLLYFDLELIIADDCSPDTTESIVNDICQTHPNASWIKYTKHKNNLGMMPNFIFAMQQFVRGDSVRPPRDLGAISCTPRA